jgi:hypothetical protein
MAEHEASRTLVKSAPELWAECSDAASLVRHLGRFGEIRITKLEPETAVAWEGDDVSGTVTLEPSGWGTRVTLTALAEDEPPPVSDHSQEAEPAPAPAEPAFEPDKRPPPQSFLARFLSRFRAGDVLHDAELSHTPASQPAPGPPPPAPPLTPQASVLVDALDSLGRAHRRPFSRG